jgi:hypothetical protein
LISSGIILISEPLFHPRYLSLVAIPVASAWIITVLSLKKSYSKILLNLVSTDTIDLKAMEETDMEQLFSGGEVASQLVQAFLGSRGNRSIWYARLLKSLGIKQLDQHLLSALTYQDDSTKAGLLELLSPQAGKEAANMLKGFAAAEKNPVTISAAIKAVNRLDPEFSAIFDYESFLNHQHPEIQAHALLGLYRRTPENFRSTIEFWLHSEDVDLRKAGIIAAGGSQNIAFADRLKEMLSAKENEPVLPFILNGLHELGTADLSTLALPYLPHNTLKVRQTALAVIEISSDALLRKIISMMGDPEENICELAKKKIETAPHQNTQLLVESLTIPNRKIRKNIFDLLESLNIKDLDIFRFAQKQTQAAYQFLSDTIRLETFPENDARNLLMAHLNQKILLRIENVLRVLAVQDSSGQIKIIYRGLLSSDTRKRSNAMEALDNMMEKRLFKTMIPLMEISSPQQTLNIGNKNFELLGPDSEEKIFISHLLSDEDWVTVALTLDMIQSLEYEQIDRQIVMPYKTSENKYISRTAERIINQQSGTGGRHGG